MESKLTQPCTNTMSAFYHLTITEKQVKQMFLAMITVTTVMSVPVRKKNKKSKTQKRIQRTKRTTNLKKGEVITGECMQSYLAEPPQEILRWCVSFGGN